LSGVIYRTLNDPGERLEVRHLAEETFTAILGVIAGKKLGNKAYELGNEAANILSGSP